MNHMKKNLILSAIIKELSKQALPYERECLLVSVTKQD